MTSSSRTEPWTRFYWSVQRQIPSSRGNSQCANTIVQLFSPQQEESIVNCAVPCSPQQHHFPGLNYYCSRTRTRHSGVLVLLQVSSTPSEPIDSSPRSDWVHCLNPYSQQNGSFLLRRMVIRKNTYTNIDNIVVEKKCYPSSGCSVMTPTIDNSNLPKFPPSPPITQWMAGAICGNSESPTVPLSLPERLQSKAILIGLGIFHLSVYPQQRKCCSSYEELKILEEKSKSFAIFTTNVCSIQYSHKSKSTTLQLHFARHLPSWIFPHLRPIVHSPILIWRIENTCGDIEKFCTLSGLYKNPHLFLQLGTNDPPTR